MKILHCDTTSAHNIGEAVGEGPYRLREFEVNVSDKEIQEKEAQARACTYDVHSKPHIDALEQASRQGKKVAEVCFDAHSFQAMMDSAALAVMAAEQSDFAVTRPPGHHAFKSHAEGFCFINNVAIGVQTLRARGVKKVCIIDIDGHHGNGTQAIFANDPDAMFVSIHQDGVYPLIKPPFSGNASDIGVGPSRKKVINIPLLAAAGDGAFMKALDFALERVKEFDPEHIAVSVGVDGFLEDSLLTLGYRLPSFWRAGKNIAALGKPVFAVLEGGYHKQVKQCVDAFIDGVNGTIGPVHKLSHLSPPHCMQDLDKKLERIAALLDAEE